VEEKKRINAFAVSLLRPGDVIVLDSGTTAGMMPEMIPDDLPLTVICYSYYIVSKLCDKPNIRLILAGGYYHRNTRIFSSEEGIRFMKQLRAQKVFLCASGIHADMGLTCTDQYIGDLKKAAISMSLEKILITDSTKFGKVDPGFFAAIEDMDRIITDSGISEEWTDLIRAKRIQLDIV
jgi:DeoR family deoxyribose operon repressor